MSKALNKKLFSVHHWLGLFVGLFIIMLSITGGILVFAPEIDGIINSKIVKVQPQPKKMSFDNLLLQLHNRFPDKKIINIHTQEKHPDYALKADIEDKKIKYEVFYNQYTGAYLGQREKDSTFLKIILQLHERLLWKGPGEILVGLFGLALLLVTITGIYFYRKSLLSVFRIGVRWDKNAKTVSSDLHKWVGVTSLLFNLIIAITGFYFHAGKFNPAHYVKQPIAKEKKEQYKTTISSINYSLDAIIKKAKLQQIGFSVEIIDFPNRNRLYVQIKGNDENSNRILGKHNVMIGINPQTLIIEKSYHIQTASFSEKADHVMHELHFGQFAGWPVKLLYLLLGLTPGLLSVTGFMLWWAKRKKKPAKQLLAPITHEKINHLAFKYKPGHLQKV